MKILLIDNYDSFTFNLYHYLSSLKVNVDVIRNNHINSIDILKKRYNKIVISPGPGNPNQSGNCLKIVKSLYKKMTLDDQINLEDKLFNEISKLNQGAVTNVSDHWIMINLKGNKVYDLLSKSCPYNFNEYKKKKGSVAQTIVNHIDVILHNKEDNNLNLFVRRSFSEDLWLWLNDSARFI